MNQQQLDDLITALTGAQGAGNAARANPVPATTQSLIPIFGGDKNAARPWIEAIEAERQTQGWSYQQTLTVAQARLSPDVKKAVKWWKIDDIVKEENVAFTGNENDADKQRWDGFVRNIKKKYIGAAEAVTFLDALMGVHQREAESPQMFASRIEGAISEFLEMPGNPNRAETMRIVRDRLGMFLLSKNTLTPEVFRTLPKVPATFQEMVDALIAAHEASRAGAGPWTGPTVAATMGQARGRGGFQSRPGANAGRGRGAGSARNGGGDGKDAICWYCGAPGHTRAKCIKYSTWLRSQGRGAANRGRGQPARRAAAAAHDNQQQATEQYAVQDAQELAYAAYVAGNESRVQSFL